MKKFFMGSLLAVMAVLVFYGQPTFATNYIVTIENNSGSKNQEFVFEYIGIGPNFKSDIPIHVVNNSDLPVTVELIDLQPVNTPVFPKPAPANNMLSHASLALLRDDVVIAQGANGAYQKLIGAMTCVPALQETNLITRFELPSTVGNEAQDTSLWVRYYFQYTVGECNIVTPPASTPNIPTPPNTGDTMLPFLAIGGLSIVSILMVLILGITFLMPLLFKRKRQRDETF